jgi:hypothetical protein
MYHKNLAIWILFYFEIWKNLGRFLFHEKSFVQVEIMIKIWQNFDPQKTQNYFLGQHLEAVDDTPLI